MSKKHSLKYNVSGVDVWVGDGYHHHNGKRLFIMGSLAVRYLLDDHIVTNKRFKLMGDIDSLIAHCSLPYTRNDWEYQLRLTIGSDPRFKEISPNSESITDLFVVRFNPTRRLRETGWERNDLYIEEEIKNVFTNGKK